MNGNPRRERSQLKMATSEMNYALVRHTDMKEEMRTEVENDFDTDSCFFPFK